MHGQLLKCKIIFIPVFCITNTYNAGRGGRAVEGDGLRAIACWDCGFEFRLGRGCLSSVSVVCYQVQVSAARRLLVERNPVDCVCGCVYH